MVYAVIDRYIKDEIKPNSLTIRERYPFSDAKEARYFAKNLKKIDRRVVTASVFED